MAASVRCMCCGVASVRLPAALYTQGTEPNASTAAVDPLQASERDALREAGRKKLDEYRKLKAALLKGDLIQVQTQQRTFSSSNLAAAAGTSSPPPERQQPQQQSDLSRNDTHDPMVDVLLAQVGFNTILAIGGKLLHISVDDQVQLASPICLLAPQQGATGADSFWYCVVCASSC